MENKSSVGTLFFIRMRLGFYFRFLYSVATFVAAACCVACVCISVPTTVNLFAPEQFRRELPKEPSPIPNSQPHLPVFPHSAP